MYFLILIMYLRLFKFILLLGMGISYDSNCSSTPPPSDYVYNTTDNITDIYPCEFGYHYLVASSAVWIAFLPFWICGLFGNCWRQVCNFLALNFQQIKKYFALSE